jgi:hypothetical protein
MCKDELFFVRPTHEEGGMLGAPCLRCPSHCQSGLPNLPLILRHRNESWVHNGPISSIDSRLEALML